MKRPPSRAVLERVGHQVETFGCSCCGTMFGTGIPYFVAKTKAGWTGRCVNPECNTDFLPKFPLFVGTGIYPSDPWSEGDRDWFRANPSRRWRLRWPMPGEVETLATDEELAERAYPDRKVSSHARAAILRKNAGARIAMAVYQFEPGARARLPFEFVSADPLESYTEHAIPRMAPSLVEVVQSWNFQRDQAKTEQDATLGRRFEAMAKIIKAPA